MGNNIKGFIVNQRSVLNNMTFITILHIFNLLAPLITYPYLVKVLSKEIYGIVLTAQVLVSYFSLIINFGFDEVGAKFVSENRDNPTKLSEIVCSVFFVRFNLWIVCAVLYLIIVFLIPNYRNHWMLFLCSYGLTFIDVFFPQYFYQGIEKMKYSTLLNISIKTLFILLIFVFVNNQSDYVLVPIFYSLGYFIAGILSFLLIFKKMNIPFSKPKRSTMKSYMKESSALLATNLIATIKDKLNVLLLGQFSGMGNVVVYDLGTRVNSLTSKPVEILRISLFPKISREKNIGYVKKILVLSLSISIVTAVVVNIFLPQIVQLFLN